MEPFAIAGHPKGTAQQLVSVNYVTPSYLKTLRIPLLEGKHFDQPGSSRSEYTAIIDRHFGDRYFHGQNPLEQKLQMGDRLFSIIGVAGNIKSTGLDVSETPMIYLDAEQMPRTDLTILVKSSIASVPGVVQSIVSEIDHDQPVYDVATLQQRIDASLKSRRFVAFLLASFSALGITVTAVGLYALLAYGIVLRRQEFGIRSAVGATANDLALLVMGCGMRLVGFGALAGSAIAIAASRYLSSELSGVQIADRLTWASVAVTLTTISVTASALPAWRASRSDPATLLKAG
jgi:putative ABC transport system permease protein